MQLASRLSCAALVLAIAAGRAHASVATNTVTPAAAALLENLAAKRAGIRTLTWHMSGAGNLEATGCYLRGQGVRLKVTSLYGGEDSEIYFLPGRCLTVNRGSGIFRRELQAQEWRLLPFLVPLLDASQLTALGAVDAPAASGNDSNRVLRLTTAFPAGRSAPARAFSLDFAFEPGTWQMQTVQLGGYGEGATFVVDGYADAGGFRIPTNLLAATVGSARPASYASLARRAVQLLQVDALQTTTVVTRAELVPDTEGLVELLSDLDPATLRSRLAEARDPQERAGLAYSLAVRLEQDNVPHDDVLAAAKQAAESSPWAVAPALLLARLAIRQNPGTLSATAEDLLTRFPKCKDAVYRTLLVSAPPDMLLAMRTERVVEMDEEADEAPPTEMRAWAERWFKDCPASRAARQHLFLACQQQGDWDRAIELAQSAADHTDPVTRSYWLQSLTMALSSAGKGDQAVAYIERLHNQQPDDIGICQLLAQAYQQQGLSAKTVALCETLTNATPEMAEWRTSALLNACQQAGQHDKATAMAEQILAASNSTLPALDAAARCFQAERQVPRALAAYRRMLAMEASADARSSRQIVMLRLCLEADRTDEAGTLLGELQQQDFASPVNGYLRSELARLQMEYLRKTGKVEEFLATTAAELAKSPTNAVLLSRLAAANLNAGHPTEATVLYRRLLAVKPDAATCSELSQCLSRTAHGRETLAIYDDCLTNCPAFRQTSGVLQQYVSLCCSEGDPDRASATLRRFPEELAHAPQIWQMLGAALREAGRLDESVAALTNAIAQSVDTYSRDQARVDLASTYGKQGKYAEAETMLRPLAAATNANNYAAQLARRELINVLRNRGSLDAYLAELKAQAGPAGKGSIETLAQTLYEAQDYAGAADAYDKLTRLVPSSQNYWQMRISALQSARQPQALLDAYEASFTNVPAMRGWTLQNYIYACQEAGQLDRAITMLHKLPPDDRSAASTWGTLGDALHNAGRWQEAIEIYSNAIGQAQNASTRDPYRLQLAITFARADKTSEAEALLHDLCRSNRTGSVGQQAQRELIRLLNRAGRADAYVATLKAAAGPTPGKDDLSLLAQVSAEAGNHAEAAGYYAQLAPINQHDLAWAHELAALQKFDAQLDLLEGALTRYPDQYRTFIYELENACERARKPERAQAALRALAEKKGAGTDLWQQLADLLQRSKRWDEAAQAYAKAEESATSDYARRESRFQRGVMLERQEKWAEASQWFSDLLQAGADDNARNRVQRQLLTIRKQTGTLDTYIAELDRATQEKPADRNTLTLLLDACETAGKPDAAARYSGMLVKLDPSENNFTRWIHALESARAYTNAVTAYEEFFRKFPGRRADQHLWNLAQDLQNTGRTSNAVIVACEATEKARNRYAYQQLAQFCQTAGCLNEAAAAWDKAIALATSPSEKNNAIQGKVRMLVEGGRTAEARTALDRLRAEKPANENESRQTNWLLLDLLQRTGELTAYVRDLENRAGATPTAADLTLLAEAYSRTQDFAKSAAYRRKLVDLQPTPEAYAGLLNALSCGRDSGAVIATCAEFFQRFPEQKSNHLGTLMWACQQMGRTDDAIAAGEEHLRLQPAQTDLYRQLADICRQAKRYDQAIAYLGKALDRNSASSADERVSLQLEQAATMLDADKVDAARKQVDAVLAAKPNAELTAKATDLANRILRQSGQWDAHIKGIEQQGLNATNEVALLQLASVYAEKNDLTAMAGVYERLIRVNPSKEYYRKWVHTLQRSKDYAKQVEAIQAMLARYPDEKGVWFQFLATAYENLGEFDKAVEMAKTDMPNRSQKEYANENLAHMLHRAGRTGEAIPYKEQAIQLASPMLRGLWTPELLTMYQETGDEVKLEKALVAALSNCAETATARYAEGNSRALQPFLKAVCERQAGFAEQFQHAADTHPDDFPAQSLASLVCTLTGQKDDADHYRQRGADILIRAADGAPDDYNRQFAAAYACHRMNDDARALPYFERLLASRPSQELYDDLARAYQGCHQTDKQLATLEAMLAKYPDSRLNGYASLAHAYMNAGQPDQAIATAQKNVENDTSFLHGRSLLVEMYARAGRLDEAVAAYRAMREQAMRAPPERRFLQFVDSAAVTIGSAYDPKGDPAKLLEFLRSARGEATDAHACQSLDDRIARLTAPPADDPKAPPPDDGQNDIRTLTAEAAENPQNPVPLLNLAALHRRLGDRVQEAATLRRVIVLDGNPKNYLAFIGCLTALRDDKGVIEAYEAMLAARPAAAPAQAADYVSAAGRAGMLDAVADKWAAMLARTPDDRTALAVQAAVHGMRDRLRSPGRKVPDATQPDVVWFIPDKGFPIRMEKGRLDDFHAFAAGMNLLQVRVAGLVSLDKRVWLATERGAFQFDAERNLWEEIGLAAAYLGKPVASVATNAAGRIVFTATIDGSKGSFVLDPTTDRWSKP